MADYKKSMEMLGRIVDLNRPPAPQRIIRASDAFSPFIDKSVGVTMADRTKAEQFGKFKGGARFPWLQNVDPAYEGQTWGFGKKGMATRMHGQFEAIPEEELLISTILGKKDMLKSNPEVFSDLVKQYKKGMKSGLLTDELRIKTNRALAGIPADDTGKLMFGPDVDIADPAFFKSLDTFDKRREVGNILGGVGVGGKKGQLFDYDAAIKKYTEPSLHEAPNMSIGPRIFTLSGTKAERPDLNAAYPHVVGGLDLGVDYTPVPRNIFLKDYHDEFMSRGKVPGWYNITQSSSMPYQKITDEWLQHLKDRGYAEGGEVEHMQAGGIKKAIGALEELTQAAPKKITHSMLRRRGMGISSKDEADALYSSGHRIFGMHEMDEIPFEITDRALFDSYAPDLLMAYPPEHLLKKASGGDVEHMQSGGIKGMVGAGAKLLSKAERDANLTKFLEDSALKQRLYHGSNQMRLSDEGQRIYAPNEGFSELLPSGTGALKSEFDKHPPAVFLSPNPEFASRFAGLQINEATPAVYPVHAKVKNPFDYANQAHMDALEREYIKTYIDSRAPAEGESLFDFKKANAALANDLRRSLESAKSHDANWNTLEDMKIQDIIRKLGHDAFYVTENGVKNIGVYDPKMIKSATGNQGTYDITTTELNKAKGGEVEHMQSGGLKTGIGLILPEVENAIAGIKEANRMPVVPMPNRWFLQPEKFPQMQGMVEKVLQRSGLPRESFTSGAYVNPITGDILDRKIFEDVGVAINPATNRPMMSAGKEAGIEELEKELGGMTRSNLVRKGLFKRTGGDSLLDDINFLATIERSGMGHKYGLATEYGSPTQMFNTGKSGNPTLRPTSRGDVFGVGDVVGRIKLGSGQHHDVYEKLFVAPKGMDVPGVKLNEASGGAVHMADGGNPSLFSDKERELIFGEGVNNPLFSIYGNTPMPPANSPVIEATPQSQTQKAIGTLGGYLDKAGRFVTEAIEPIAQSNPIKAAIADMFIAEQLKNAGTALQDWTKTGRDYDERPYTSGPFYGGKTLQTFKFDPRTIDLLGVGQAGAYGATRLASAGAKAAAPYATKIDDVVREIYESNKIPQIGLSIKDVTPKALAPANEMGFYSPAEAAALNLQRKSGSGQAFLNDLLKQENVRPDEINAMGLDTFLKDKKDVTAAEVQDFIANNKIQLGETVYSTKGKGNFLNFLKDKGYSDDDALRILNSAEDGNFEGQVGALRTEFLNSYNQATKYKKYSLPGGENYREVVLTLPQNKTAIFPKQAELDAVEKQLAQLKAEGNREEFGKLIGTQTELRNERTKFLQAEQYRLDQEANKNQYRSSHWDEPNPLAHLRMSDRVTDGKKTLLVDEVQSDWHQAGREQGYKGGTVERAKDYKWDKSAQETLGIKENDPAWVAKDRSGNVVGHYTSEDAAKTRLAESTGGVPNAPFKEDWYQLALKRAIKEAIDNGYDRVALPTGNRVAERFDLSKQVDSIAWEKNPDGTYTITPEKDGNNLTAPQTATKEKLAGIIGKDVANKITSSTNNDGYLSGLDLKVGGEGMRKYYDEIYPGYLKKFGKKYGANVGTTYAKTDINEWPFPIQIESDGKNFWLYGQDPRIDKKAKLSGNFNSYEEANKFRDSMYEGNTEPLHYMEITPAMREAFKTGIHMKDGGAVHMQSGGMPRTPVGGEMKHTSFQELREEMGMADGGDIMHRLVKYAAAGGEIDDLQHSMAKQYLETLNG